MTLAAALAAIAIGCAERPAEQPQKPLVLVSLRPQEYFVNRIAEGAVDVKLMIPPGADPESFEPSFSHLRSFTRASVYITAGPSLLPFERDWLPKLKREMPQLTQVDGSSGMKLRPDDPHLWLSPKWGFAMVAATEGMLGELRPDMRERFGRNRKLLESELQKMEDDIRQLLAGVRAFASFHPTWSYFAEHFGIEQISIEEEGKEPDPASLGRRLAAIKERGLSVLIIDPYSVSHAADSVAEEAGLRLETVDPLAYDWIANLKAFAALIAGERR